MNWTLHLGHALDVLRTLPAESVNCIVTSPPYFGLRDYGVDGQIGLEPSPDEFVASLVAVFAEARRVLLEDGCLFLNLGDSYAANRGYQVPDSKWTDVGNWKGMRASDYGLKPKDLIGIPWLAAFALRADGWYLRSDIIWHKPNPMPESVTDRPTKAHEYVFLLTKSARYQYNQDAIREAYAPASSDRYKYAFGGSKAQQRVDQGLVTTPVGMRDCGSGANARTIWTIPTEASPYDHFAVMPKALARKCILAGCPYGGVVLDPFAGMATTGAVALEEGRSFVGIELNPKYHAAARERLAGVAPLLATEKTA